MTFLKNLWIKFLRLRSWQKIVVVVLIFAAIGGATGSNDTTSTSTDSTSDTSTTKTETVKNPLDTSDNQLACRSARREVAKQSPVISDAGNGAATMSEAAAALGAIGNKFSDLSFATGEIGQVLAEGAIAYKQARVALLSGDVDAFSTASGKAGDSVKRLNVLCTSIGQ